MTASARGLFRAIRDEARANGLRRYFTGRPCIHGHVAERLVSNKACVECDRVNKAKMYACGDPRVRAQDKKRYWKDVAKSRANNLANYRKHAAKRRAYDKARASTPKRAAEVNMRTLAYAKRHRGRMNARLALRRARQKQATPVWLTHSQLAEMQVIYEHARANSLEVDHVIPLSGEMVSGLHVPWNLQAIPRTENRRKANKLAELP